MKKLLLIAIASLWFSGCASHEFATGKSEEIVRTPITSLMVTDLKVDPVKKEHSVNGKAGEVAKLQRQAASELLKKENADVIIEPNYHVIINGVKATVTVKARVASYKNFRNASDEDILTIQQYGVEKKEVKVSEKKKEEGGFSPSVKAVLYAVGAVALLGILMSGD